MDFQSEGLGNAIHDISDVEVVTVGLVSKAAVGDKGINFVLKKSDAESVAEMEEVMTNQLDEVIAEEKEDGMSILKSIGEALGGIMKASVDEIVEAVEPVDVEVIEEADDGVTELQKAFDEKFVDMQKAFDDKLEEIQKAHNEQLGSLKEVVETREAELAKADAELVKAEWLKKSADIEHLPMANDVIGEKLYELSKSADAGWVVDLLKAVDAQVKESGIFNELGSSQQENELDLGQKIEKAQSEGDAANALLGLSKEEQAELVKSFRG